MTIDAAIYGTFAAVIVLGLAAWLRWLHLARLARREYREYSERSRADLWAADQHWLDPKAPDYAPPKIEGDE